MQWLRRRAPPRASAQRERGWGERSSDLRVNHDADHLLSRVVVHGVEQQVVQHMPPDAMNSVGFGAIDERDPPAASFVLRLDLQLR